MHINGVFYDWQEQSVMDILQKWNYPLDRIVVELNGEIITPTDYSHRKVKPTDYLEIVSFVGGG